MVNTDRVLSEKNSGIYKYMYMINTYLLVIQLIHTVLSDCKNLLF